jgi:hypothetical protein
VRNLTELVPAMSFNEAQGGEDPVLRAQDRPMLAAIIVTLLVIAFVGYAPRSPRTGKLIVRRPYNNRYNDASGSREDHLG